MLLPISTCDDCRKVSYQISAINGCFSWDVSHPNLIEIKTIPSKVNPECTNIAIVKAISNKPTKSLIWISAKDKNSGQVLRCEVKLGRIERLEIQTHLRQFYLNDFEHLHIAAYDEEGNIFSGLEGFQFEWNVESGNDKVKIVSWKDASHTSSELKQEFELNKLQSDVLFLKGIAQGTSVVSTRINEKGYENVDSTAVTLTITEPFVVIPQTTVYLLPTSKYQFQLAKVTLKNNDMSFTPVSLPNKQYQWNVDESEKGDIGEDGVFISKTKEGFVSIVVVDQNIANNTAESSVKVVLPQLLDFEISDIQKQLVDEKSLLIDDTQRSYQQQLNISKWDNNWILVEGHHYLLKVFLYDRDKNQIFMTDNVVITNVIDKEYFDVIKVNKLNTEVIVKAKKATKLNQKTVVTSILDSIKSESKLHVYHVDKSRLRSDKDVIIAEPLRINHPTDLVLLPILKHADSNKNGEIWQLSARGGSGYNQWSILDENVATITGSGLIRSVDVGTTTIFVRDTMNAFNYATIQIEVTPVASLTWLEDHVEVKKNQEQTILSVIALDKNGRKFTNCTSLDISFDLKGEGILEPLFTFRKYKDITNYIKASESLIQLKQKFENNPSANFISELPSTPAITDSNRELYLHNNFGICNQQRYAAVGEGLARIKAHFINQLSLGTTQVLETHFAEVASYDSLITKTPTYNEFFSDLYSKTYVQQEEIGFQRFIDTNAFILAFGTSLKWSVSGGTNFWKDIPEKYQSSISVKSIDGTAELDKNILTYEKLSEQTAQFQFGLKCLKPSTKVQMQLPHKYQATLLQQNLASRFLLRPASHQLSIDVYCEPPKNLQLFWSQENQTLSQYQYRNLPSYRTFSSEKHHYVLVNSEHNLRVLLFNQSNYVFYNHSSINVGVQSTNDKMAVVKQRINIPESFDTRNIHILNQTGTVHINAAAKGYFSNFFQKDQSDTAIESLNLPYEVKDSFRLEIVRNVDVQPKFKSIYLHKDNKFTFRIMHGSGHFSVTINNTDIAEKHYIDGERTVTITPRREGPIEIKIEDIEIPDSFVSISELLISDIARLELDSPQSLIEQGSSMELNVTAFDLYQNPFDDDQYLNMNFNIEIEISQQRDKGLLTESDPSNNRRFIARGFEAGTYQTTAISPKYRPFSSSKQDERISRITSEVLKIEVFPLLEINPPGLLLTPQMKYTLQIVGGPQRTSSQTYQGGSIEIKFEVENKQLASVDQFREVTGLLVGDTNLYYEIIQVKQGKGDKIRRSIVSKRTIPIRVRLVTSIDIPYNDQRTVYSGSMIKMIAILKYNDETFTQGIAPISYSWNVSNPNVLGLNLPHKGENQLATTQVANTLVLVLSNKKIRDNEANNNNVVFLTHFNSSTVYSTGNKAGEAFINLQLALEYPELYKNERNWFSKTITLNVKDKLKVDIPEFINNPDKQTHLYLMPPNSYSKIDTNRKTKLRLGYSQQSVYDYSTNSYQFKEVQTPIISLEREEGIRTFDKYGKVTVIIEENQAFSDQVVMLNVLITDIYSIAAKDVYQTLSFPLGSQMNIPVKFQNEHGHQFANNIEGIEVGFELSHPRVVSAQLDQYNSTFTLKAEGSGECNVVVYLIKNPHIYDLFKVRVSSVVKPYSPVQVHVGGAIKFKIMDQQQQQSQESSIIWSSNNPAVIDINQRTGEALALMEGKADILLSNNINAASIVTVSKVKSAEVDQASRKYLIINADESSGDTRVRIKLFMADQFEELTPTVQFDGITLINQNVGLICESDDPSIVATWSEINELEGFFCVISFRGQGQRSIPKSSSIHVTVYGPNPKEPTNHKNALYKERLLTFDLTFLSKIIVESFYKNGIALYNDQRTVSAKIFSNTHFQAFIQNRNEQDKGYELVKFKVNKTSEASTEYLLTVTVPQEITHDFQADIILVHPVTNAKTVISLTFESRNGRSYLSKVASKQPERREMPGEVPVSHGPGSLKDQGDKGTSFMFFLLFTVFVLVLVNFLIANCTDTDPLVFWKRLISMKWPFEQKQVQPARKTFASQPLMSAQSNVKNSFNYPPSMQNSFVQPSGAPQYGAARQAQGLNLSRVDYSAGSGQKYRTNSIYKGLDY